MKLQLQLEDQSCQNNIQPCVIPEATAQENLQEMVKTIFLKILEATAPLNLELNRVQRALGPKSRDLNRPSDVICRLHYFTHREAILKKAWVVGGIDYQKGAIKDFTGLIESHTAM